MTWAAGIRAPINNRIVKGTDALDWGCPSTKYADDSCLFLGDFFPWGEDNFCDYRPIGNKSETRPKEPATVNMFGKCAPGHPRYFDAVYGGEQLEPRLEAIGALANTHEDRPEVPPIDFVGDVWNRMHHDFTDACLEGIRRIVRISPPGSKRDKIAKFSWIPRADGTPLWQFPDTFTIDSENGFWQSIIIHELGRKMESQMIANALGGVESITMRNLEIALREERNQKLLTLMERDYVQTNRTRRGKCPA